MDQEEELEGITLHFQEFQYRQQMANMAHRGLHSMRLQYFMTAFLRTIVSFFMVVVDLGGEAAPMAYPQLLVAVAHPKQKMVL